MEQNLPTERRALLLGHFSTVGDIACLEYTKKQSMLQGIPYDVCAFMPVVGEALQGSLRPKELNPSRYSHFIFICGPCWPELFQENSVNLSEYSHCCRIGINLTMVKPLQEWNPFHHLIERDSDREVRPDLSFFEPIESRPVLAVCLIESQPEYGDRQRHKEAIGIINDFFKTGDYARIDLDTRWPGSRNTSGSSDPVTFLSLMGRADALITNRLHGLAFGLKAGIPVVAIDSIVGGDKVSSQARALEWPLVLMGETMGVDVLKDAVGQALSDELKSKARGLTSTLAAKGEEIRKKLSTALSVTTLPEFKRTQDLVPPQMEKKPTRLAKHPSVLRFRKFLRGRAEKLIKRL